MNLKLNTPAEAYLAVAAVAVGADKVGSLAEQQFLFERFRHLDVFQGHTTATFEEALAAVTRHVYDTLATEDVTITPAGINTLIRAVRALLTPEQEEVLIKVVSLLCYEDGICDEEMALLKQLERGFALA